MIYLYIINYQMEKSEEEEEEEMKNAWMSVFMETRTGRDKKRGLMEVWGQWRLETEHPREQRGGPVLFLCGGDFSI